MHPQLHSRTEVVDLAEAGVEQLKVVEVHLLQSNRIDHLPLGESQHHSGDKTASLCTQCHM